MRRLVALPSLSLRAADEVFWREPDGVPSPQVLWWVFSPVWLELLHQFRQEGQLSLGLLVPVFVALSLRVVR